MTNRSAEEISLKVAIVHYWLVNWRGGEKVLEALLLLFPRADIYAHVVDESVKDQHLFGKSVRTTFIQSLPGAVNHYQKYLPLMPLALEQLDLREYDLVISSESGPAKGVVTGPGTVHICYCHSPMRYVWDMYPDYLESSSFLTRLFMRPLIHYLKIWDRLSSDRVDHFIANSTFVAERIQKFYRRDAQVIHPPVDVSQFEVNEEKSDFYLVFGQLTEYKRADLAVEAFLANGKKLIVIGEGEQYKRLKARETENVRILGRLSNEQCRVYLSEARALVFPGVEDFGMVPVEAMACGTPVIAYAVGGALETVKEGVSGVLFHEQTVAALNECLQRFESSVEKLDMQATRLHAEAFSTERFLREIEKFLASKMA